MHSPMFGQCSPCNTKLLHGVFVLYSVAAAWCTGVMPCDVWCSRSNVAQYRPGKPHQSPVPGKDERLCGMFRGNHSIHGLI